MQIADSVEGFFKNYLYKQWYKSFFTRNDPYINTIYLLFFS